MRRRLTFIHDQQLDINPRQLVLSGDVFRIDGLNASREERLTFGFSELPQELWQVLKQSHELHIRWASQIPYASQVPYVSRISPGLHVFYTPQPRQTTTTDLLCPLLHKVFSEDLKCQSPNITFSTPPLVSSRFASTSSLQYHSLLPSLNNLVVYLQRKVCAHSDQACIHAASLLSIVDSLDVDYDSISHALIFTAYWSKPPRFYVDPLTQLTSYNSWTLNVDAQHGNKVEVGILSSSTPADPHDLQLSGSLTVVGEDPHPKATLFDFPSRHHPSHPSNRSPTLHRLLPPTHRPPPNPSDLFPLRRSPPPPTTKPKTSTCALHAYLTLPASIFADVYQLSSSDALFLASHHLSTLRSISGATDLEAPSYVVPTWGSNLLIELAYPITPPSQPASWNVTIPLHLRYLAPSSSGDHTNVTIPHPAVFWACTADNDASPTFTVNPFDRTNLGYDGLFGPRTLFYHLTPAGSSTATAAATAATAALVETVEVPVLDLGSKVVRDGWIDLGTVLAVLLGFAWVVGKLWPALKAQLLGTRVVMEDGKKER